MKNLRLCARHQVHAVPHEGLASYGQALPLPGPAPLQFAGIVHEAPHDFLVVQRSRGPL
jgi:hypothetical protein